MATASEPALAAKTEATEVEEGKAEFDYRPVSALGLLGAYVGFGGWTWLAWYRARPASRWTYGGDGAFSFDSYAGGADKFGHAWSTLVLTRLGADLLEVGGWSDPAASAIASGLCLGAFTLIEVNDGYYTEFSATDLSANLAGVAAALLMRHIPRVDDAFDFRVQWFPSAQFRASPSANFAEDYSGQTYLLAFKPGAFSAISEFLGPAQFLQFANPVLGFAAHNYVPKPPPGQLVTHRQSLFLGLTVDVQAVLDVTLRGATSSFTRVSRDVGRTVFEYVNLPFTTLPIAQLSREGPFVAPRK